MAAAHFLYFMAELVIALIILRMLQIWGPAPVSNALGALHS